jgi:hypothetical protein
VLQVEAQGGQVHMVYGRRVHANGTHALQRLRFCK